MKKNLLLIALLALGWLVSSCGSRTELIKRHYTKGFYVAGNSNRQIPGSRSFTRPYATKKVNQVVVADGPDRVNEVVALAISSPTVAGNHQGPDKSQGKLIVKKRNLVTNMPGRTISLHMPRKTDNDLKELNKAKMSAANGYSLLWIIVVVLLIFWLLGFLTGGFGIGNLINLLLVVALILLILWLLKVL